MATRKSSNPLTAMSAGCIAGAVEATAVWPMEFIKTQLQLGAKSGSSKLPYNGMLQGLSYTVRTTGFLSLYRGLAPTLVGSIPKAGIRFGLNSVIKEKLRDENGKLTAGKNFVAGLGAGVSEALLIVAPVETVKTKVIELNMPFLEGLKHIIKTEGFGGVYQGAAATAMKQGSNQGLRFMWFNEYKKRVTNDGEKKLTPIMGLFGGMSAGCFSTLGNNPFDVIKTRMQGTQAAQYKNTLDCFKQILSKEGAGAFYAGVAPRLGRVVPGQGIIFMSFESIQTSLESNFSIFKS
mmetsp:Transcript_14248/g.29753  ORF Transcript_14248/g.29753 Transcript_14248/m.29753 type:complete len:292 (-) Transcript_14248:358-1233(-)|eukprot:CAMPEP_0201116900 /NCGR_PEP_ID=MMETSP0850-20130426/1047_1 /ASSEMBLY_ACC=CAM_ASM_000622 /TAXON_ID=183588 /ORGANISM="Pseudo-nitzschia fraudulenta, Strain WWA7" /LENGTH=291 /DNA_ID=CAMNT_0047381103 /DNA_START=186 /DNA_END=1061 /DNA_ORIENTATION=+